MSTFSIPKGADTSPGNKAIAVRQDFQAFVPYLLADKIPVILLQ